MKFKFKKAFGRKAACIALAAAMSATFAAGQIAVFAQEKGATDGETHSLQFENANGKFNLTDVKLNNLNKQVFETEPSTSLANVRHTVFVTLEGAPLADREDSKAALRQIEREQAEFFTALKASGIEYTVRSTYSSILNGVAIEVKLSTLKDIKAINGVKTVSVSNTYARPQAIQQSDGAQTNYSNIYASGIYDSSKYLDKADGTGMTVAILDTGLDYTHPAFAVSQMDDPDSGKFTFEDIEGLMSETRFKAESRSGATAEDVYISKKVPFAYDYADNDSDVYPTYSQHGTHVAGIVGGKADSYDTKDGLTAKDENGNVLPFRGVAPEAQLVICKVFTDNFDDKEIGGAEAVDIVDALEDCYNLNVDIINMSLGTSSGFSSQALGLTAADEEGLMLEDIYNRLRGSGISLLVAASNEYSSGYGSAFGTNLTSNPDSGTVGAPSTYDGVMSIASINGQLANYIVVNGKSNGTSVTGGDIMYYEESRNEDSDAYSFLGDLLGCDKVGCTDEYHESNGLHDNANIKQSGTFKYVVIPGYGTAGDYTRTIRNELKNKEGYDKVIAVVRRGGGISFKDKIETAASKENGADAVIVYNNVSGLIRMSLGDMQDHVPAISVSLDAGLMLTGTGASRKTKGTITLDRSYKAGPFMNDYSSWGVTPDLQLKPDITSHGGEITSTVAGGYDEMSGTSMACPNFAGFTALLRGWLQNEKTELWRDSQRTDRQNAIALNDLVNNLTMSTATTVYDENNLPYSPRKQGAGLATLENVFNKTNAYLYTEAADKMNSDAVLGDGTVRTGVECRPKAELGDDSARTKKGEYTIKFAVKNFGEQPLTFKTNSIFMTETVGADGKSVAEKAHVFGDDATWTVDGAAVAEGGEITVDANSTKKITVVLQLTAAEMKYLETNFKNGMFVEGFLQLISVNKDKQCDLTFPFMGFYGDWEAAPMLDLTCFDVAADAKDTTLKDEERRQPGIWATQPYGYYYDERYTIPLGSFLYLQDERLEHTADYVYVDEEHIAISGFTENYGDSDSRTYLTTTGIRALYAGLLRNAEIATYTVTNVDTGEIVPDENGNTVREEYRITKAMAAGGSAIPAPVLVELRTEDLNLPANGKYRMDFNFYRTFEQYRKETADGTQCANTFSMSFYIDYEAPILVDSRIRFQDLRDESNREVKRVYLDLDVFDNHYPQAVLLCYAKDGNIENSDSTNIVLATEYITPILNPKKNTINTVSIDISAFYEQYKGMLFVEIDDYAMNHNMYYINLAHSQHVPTPAEFKVMNGGKEVSELTLQKNTAVKLTVDELGNSNISNFSWESGNPLVAIVKNGEIFGVAPGRATITVRGAKSAKTVTVNVTDGKAQTRLTRATFGTVINTDDNLVQAVGTVKVNPAQQFKLSITPEPWYYAIDNTDFTWTTTDANIVDVDQEGNVTVIYEGDKVKTATVTATSKSFPSVSASVLFSVCDPFEISNGTLTRYRGWGGELVNGERVLTIPNDRSITSIGENAFRNDKHVRTVIIPKAVTTISERAFLNCTGLTKLCFVSDKAQEIADSSLSVIRREAFSGCTSLKTLDLSNCKVITLDRDVFTDCTALEEVIKMTAIGCVGANSFAGCTSLKNLDLSKLHVVGVNAFGGCTALEEVTTGAETAMNVNMFSGCTALKEIEIYSNRIPAYAFDGCTSLSKVTLNCDVSSVGAYAFARCGKLANFDLNGHTIKSLGDGAFSYCVSLNNLFETATFRPELGDNVFDNVASITGEVSGDGTLYLAPHIVESADILDGITAVSAYAFSNSVLGAGVEELDLSNLTSVGSGAFANLKGLKSVILPTQLTKIPSNLFKGSGLVSITIPATVTEIADGAFENCESLASVTFASGSSLTKIGRGAFGNTAITQLTLPDGVTEIGDEAFARSLKLESADISSVTRMGEGAFALCPSLTSVTFGANATTAGSITFLRDTALTSVELSEKITALNSDVFAYCTSLKAIDLKNVTTLGSGVFGGCNALATVTGIDKVKRFGENCFADCTSLTALDLSAAEEIFYNAFYGATKVNSLTLRASLKGIGDYAFSGTAIKTVTIPSSCEYVGVSAFGSCALLKEINVNEDNKLYFSEDGVLYRTVSEGVYELCAYPAGKVVAWSEGARTYKIKEGTATTQAFAFFGIPQTALTKVVFPYTVKSIGRGAFLTSGVTNYEFESINAPVLLEEMSDRVIAQGNYSANSFFYDTFVDYLAGCTSRFPGDSGENASTKSNLTIAYPKNGVGYDNFVYSNYFGGKSVLAELPEDNTRTLKSLIEGLTDAQTVGSWNTTNTDKKSVESFADTVMRAHGLYNLLKTDVQRDYVGKENIDKLFAVEAALKPVKETFGIKVDVMSVTVASDSAHKSQYAVGDKFSLNGLKLLIVYSDYSQQTVDANEGFALAQRFDRELRAADETVTVEGSGAYDGLSVSVKISVKEGGVASAGGTNDKTLLIVLVVCGGVALLAVAAIVTLIVLAQKGVITFKGQKRAQKTAEGESVAAEEQPQKEIEEDAAEDNKAEAAETAEETSEETSEDTNGEAPGEGTADDGDRKQNGGEDETDD